ncbi:MAG: glycoside hydrolase family 3 N-terminal domain-containing protein [Arcobacteraceae bacterium]
MIKIMVAMVLALELYATALPSKEVLEKQIGKMIIVGFDESELSSNSPIIKAIKRYDLGGVILFDRFYNDTTKVKNIDSPQQLQMLTQKLKEASPHLMISIDQEGGKVQRLKSTSGFLPTSSAKEMASKSVEDAYKEYAKLALMLQHNGINTNFAPVVDLALNPNNTVIYQLERSYSDDPQKVVHYATAFIEAQNEKGVMSVLKHFPGHGSSLNDSHEGFVDVTQSWHKMELEPFKSMIKNKSVSMIMTAHIFNAHLDPKYPATLSHNINTKLLRENLGFEGVLISDDLQMKAISEHYTLAQTVTLAINSGVDIVLFGNQLGSQNLEELIETIYQQVVRGNIAYERILQSNARIKALSHHLK